MKKALTLIICLVFVLCLGFVFTGCNKFKIPDREIKSKHSYVDGICSECGYAASVWDGKSAMGFSSGSGTENDPFIINTAKELAYFANSSENNSFSEKYIKLTSNIDLNGLEWKMISNFNGVFDGDGHSISYFTIRKTQSSNVGFFERVGGTIKNLILSNFYYGVEDKSKLTVGGITAYLIAGVIENCAVYDAEIRISAKDGLDIGGIVGKEIGASMENTIVRNCYAKKININGQIRNSGRIEIGGIAGSTGSADFAFGQAYVQNCYSEGMITATHKASSIFATYSAVCAGIVGNMSSGNVQNCFSACDLEINADDTNDQIGGIVVYTSRYSSTPKIEHCYSIDGQQIKINGKLLQNSQLADHKYIHNSSLAGVLVIIKDIWNNSIWTFSENEYPQLSRFSRFESYCR